MNTELSQRPLRPSRRGAFTMIELLVSMAISLVVVYALVEFMKEIGDTVTDGRAMIDLATQLRGARQRLDDDLRSITVQARPWADSGYFEYREGPLWDADADGNGVADFGRAAATDLYNIEANGGNTLFGDWDDILAFTAHAGTEPFVGRIEETVYVGRNGNSNSAQSQMAEIIWFTGFEDVDSGNDWDVSEPRYIYRRVLLIRPDWPELPATGAYGTVAEAYEALMDFWVNNDVSMRVVQTGANQFKLRPNSLSDLSRRESRFAHQYNFPHRWDFDPRGTNNYVLGKSAKPAFQGVRLGEDIMLSRLLAFDVQVFDPNAIVAQLPAATDPTGAAITPDSPEWGGAGQIEIGRGAYVDLGYRGYNATNNRPYANTAVNANGQLAYDPDPKSGFYSGGNVTERVWDSWSSSYESDGIDQYSDSRIDQAHDGIDNDNRDGVDDVGERETSPPYPVPIRGIRVTIRIYDPSTRQVRQGVVTAEFMPE